MRKAWRVVFKDGTYTMVRVAKKSVSFRQCLEILDYRGYTHTDIWSLDEEWEED